LAVPSSSGCVVGSIPCSASHSRAADRSAPPGFASAVYFEMVLLENPYSARAWAALRRLYSAPGLEARAAGLEARRREGFK